MGEGADGTPRGHSLRQHIFTSCPDLSPRATRANKAAYAVKELRQYSLPSATARVSTTTMGTVPSWRLGDLGNMCSRMRKKASRQRGKLV